MPLDDLIATVETFNWAHPFRDGRVWPFGIVYALWGGVLGPGSEYGLLALPVIFVLQALVWLGVHWSVDLRRVLCCVRSSPTVAETCLVRPTENNGDPEFVPICRDRQCRFFVFQKTKYVFNNETECFEPLKYPIAEKLSMYFTSSGIDEEEANTRRSHFGANLLSIDAPEFWPLFVERATAPFFVFQVFCVGLWCLDDYWYYSIFTLMMLVMFECTLVQQTMRNLSEVRRMADYTSPRRMLAYRVRRWVPVSSQNLVPGDLISITRSDDALPCDVLLLRGTAVVDESLMTGESIPLIKEGLDQYTAGELQKPLDVQADTKLHILSGGTKVLQHFGPPKTSVGIKPSDSGCLGYVLRTGFNTSQGKLLRTILFGVKRVTANNKETFAFILFLLVFAIAAASYVWTKGIQDPNRSRYKLMLECTLILTSVVPPELPIELSLAVNSSLLALARLGIFCTEAFRIPFAGKVSFCCFDKTGTLTSDKLQIDGVAEIGGRVTPAVDSSPSAVRVMATCHSLVLTDSGFVGDPLEKATLAAIQWSPGKGDVCTPDRSKQPGMRIHRRFHFSSALGRMSVITSSLKPDSTTVNAMYQASVKGAPEIIRTMLRHVPDGYDETHRELSFKGARVLALAHRDLGSLDSSSLRELSRDTIESQLEFCGFLVVSCPIKKDSFAAIRQIRQSSHHVTIITGDAPLTACHIARELSFVMRPCLVLDARLKRWVAHGGTTIPLLAGELPSSAQYDLCVTGDALDLFERTCGLRALAHVRVFARVVPKQKEAIITRLNRLGFVTSMTGDGTNDMGALKHAHVGVALLSDGPARPKPPKPRPRPDQLLQRLPPRSRTPAALEQMLKDLETEEGLEVVKLGDASIAAPFTYKGSSVECLTHILKQGRCTLVTTLQMFKILALNALVLAYSQSVLYLDGIKFSDSQATLQGLLLAMCFLFISRSKPLEKLSAKRPLANIFNAYTLLTVMFQFGVHLATLIYLTGLYEGLKPKNVAEDSKFEPSLLNSTVYILSIALQISTFAVNYRGRPFMESLLENKALLYALMMPAVVVVALVKNWAPDLSNQLELVEFPEEQGNLILLTLAADMVVAFSIDRLLGTILAKGAPVPLPVV